MKKVVLLKSRLEYNGGLEKYTIRLAKGFAERGAEVTILTTDTPVSVDGVQVLSLGRSSKLSFLNLTRFDSLCKKWLISHPHEIIFGMERTTFQTHYRAGSGVHAVYLKRRALIEPLHKRLSFSLNPLHKTVLKMEKEAFESPHLQLLFTNSNMVRDEILENYSTPKEKIRVVHNGVEWKEWEEPFASSSPREGPFRFLFVGNGYQRKGLSYLLEGLSCLSNRNWTLTVVGKEKNLSYYQQLAEDLNLGEKIEFVGSKNSLIPFYQKADSLVLPTLYDPFSNVTVEALAMGLFVVSSPFNGGSEVLTPESGVVIENLFSKVSVANSLALAIQFPKTLERALAIRMGVKELDFSNQLAKIVQATLS